jgi:tetratricopeptide (TPR) repeat protein
VERHRGEVEEARRRLEALRGVHPGCVLCTAEAGDLERAAGNLPEAEALYRQALEDSGEGYPYAALRLAQTLVAEGDGEEARSWLEKTRSAARQALDKGVEDPWPAWIAAAAEAQGGDPRTALSLLRTAVQGLPGGGWRRWDLDDDVFAPLRPDPLYQALLEENRIALLAMRRRIEAAETAEAKDP